MDIDASGEPTAPLHVRIFQTILADIQSGRYPIGSLLPTEHELAAQFGASRQTVRHAIDSLRQNGLVSSHRGIGTRIENSRAARPYNYSAQSIEDLFHQAKEMRLEPIFRNNILVEGRFAALLGVRSPQRWVHLGCLRYVRDEQRPMCWTDIYIDMRLQDLVASQGPISTPVFPRIEERLGTPVTKIHQQIRAVVLSPSLIERLGVEPPGAALEITRRYAFGERVLQVSVNTLPADRFSYTVDIIPGNDLAMDRP